MFNTPWGKYRVIHFPWGLTCAQDIFQQMMDQILEHCEGAIGIADDVHGKDDAEHDWNLHRFMNITHEHGLVFIESLMMLLSMEKMMMNITGTYTGSCAMPVSMDLPSVETNVKSRRNQSNSLAPSKMLMELIQTLKR